MNHPNIQGNIQEKTKEYNTSKILEYAKQLPNGGLHIKQDTASGLIAIIAIHNTDRGPALGGCRYLHYHTLDAAILDAMRLARGMSYKAAISGVPTGGGKAVIMKPDPVSHPKALFTAFAEFVNQFGGQYITAMDSGTSLAEMDIIAETTPYIASLTTHTTSSHGDPSPLTALGVLKGIEAAVSFRLRKTSLANLHVAIQGTGHVGLELARLLHAEGATLSVSDVNPEALSFCKTHYNAHIVPPDHIYDIECDVFSPCALGGTINTQTVPRLRTAIVAGCANNQLENEYCGQVLHNQNILYAPDYAINAGGLIFAHALYAKLDEVQVSQNINHIYDALTHIFETSQRKNLPTNLIADHIAEEKLLAAQNAKKK